MVNLEQISSNLVIIINKLKGNDDLLNYLVPDKSGDSILPTPFDPDTVTNDVCQVRVYYGRGVFDNVAVDDLYINFDIISSKSLWLLPDEIRPYEVMKQIVNMFEDGSINLEFLDFRHVYANNQFDGIQLTARVIDFYHR